MTPSDTYRGLRAFADELARCGVRHACTSPGSRSTPLVLSLVREAGLAATSHLDERAGAFFAVGVGKATGMPAVLACTSGTAAANYAPAVIEAFEARVPLIVLTADRPPELRDVGAGQTIDQVKLYGRAAKLYVEVDDAPATPARLRWLRQLACRAVQTTLDGRPGPVHLNFSLREPLILDEDLEPDTTGRPDGAPWTSRTGNTPDRALYAALVAEIDRRPRAIFVAGRTERPDEGEMLALLAQRMRLPLLAEPTSGARRGEAIAHYDAFLRDPAWAARHEPDLVVRVGDVPTSKTLRQWLAGLEGARQILLDPEDAWGDPDAVVHRRLRLRLRGAPADLPVPQGDEAWLRAWLRADKATQVAFGEVLGFDELSEPTVAAALGALLPGDATLVVASSMPVRDLDTFAPTRDDPPRVLANRGANGIDGTTSTAFGVAAATGAHTVLLTGDVALLHDLNGLLAARRTRTKLVVVVVNNGGGGIFDFLPVSTQTDAFEEHVATPHGVDVAQVAALFDFDHHLPEDLPAFGDALEAAILSDRSALIEVRTDRAANVALHRRVWDRVAESVRRAT